MSGALAEFFYVGGQACVGSFFIKFSEKVAGLSEKAASHHLFAGSLCRFYGGQVYRHIADALF
jgi:fucose permease